MKPFLVTICILLTLASTSLGQDGFAAFAKAVKDEQGGFAGNKEKLSKVFNDERIRLGPNFEPELWKYLGNDADKYYWIGSFLTSRSYLHGNTSMPQLAFEVRVKALKLLEKRNDEHSLGQKVTIDRHLAVSAKLAGKQDQANRFRDDAERILSRHGDKLWAYLGGVTEFDKCVYDNLEGSVDKCDPNPPQREKIVSAGWLNSRALNFAQPNYPATITKDRKAARVEVKVLTDESGQVIKAEIIRGAVEFHEAALEAARRLRFPPTTLSGVPTKVSGWVSYDFKP